MNNMENNTEKKRKLYGMIIGVVAFIAVVAGLTYAWFTWASNNTIIQGDTGCFTIQYTNGTAISGSLAPSSDYTGGKSTTATLNINSTCTTDGDATINLVTDSSAGTAINLATGAVKYAVYQGTTEVNSGTVSSATQALATFALTKVATTYTVYVWVDGEIADNTFVGKTYSGYISGSAVQVERSS